MTTRTNFKLLTSAMLVSVALTGCGSSGDDGDAGKPGEPGLIGLAVTEAKAINADITSVSVADNGTISLDFTLANANGVALHSLKDTDIAGLSFGRMGKESEVGLNDAIEGGADNDRDIWLSYYVKSKGEFEGQQLLAGSSYFSGISYNGSVNCTDCLTDNGDGSYTLVTQGTKADGSEYKVAINPEEFGLNYGYNADATNGVYMAIKVRDGNLDPIHPADNANIYLNTAAFHYWQPSSDTVVERPKAVIADATCESCHRPEHDGNLGNQHHAGKHTKMESCSFCHVDFNQYAVKDADKNVIGNYDGSIKGLAHNLHLNLEANEKTPFPQSAANCQSCHSGDVAQVDAWKADQDAATCVSCHQFAPSYRHAGLADPDKFEEGLPFGTGFDNCTQCHTQDGYARGAEQAHVTHNAHALSGSQYKVTFSNVTIDKSASVITVTMAINNGDELIPLSQIDPRDYKYGGKSSAIVFNGLAKGGDDFLLNYQKVGVALSGFGKEASYASANPDGTITVTIPDISNDGDSDTGFKVKELLANAEILALSSQVHVCHEKQHGSDGFMDVPVDCVVLDSNGSGTLGDVVEIQDKKVIDNLNSQEAPYVTSDTQYFQANDGTYVGETPRVQHAAMENCQQCHDTGIQHRFSNDLDGCASCHNGTRDKNGMGSSNLGYITHSKHYIGGFFKKTDCQTCHGADGFSLSNIHADAAPVAFGTNDGQRLGADNEQLFVSPQAAACVSCHQMPYGMNDGIVAHINQNGGVMAINAFDSTDADGKVTTSYNYGVTQAEYDAANAKEACSVCHNSEQLLEAHANWSSGH
ncbi:hypothetical protein [uncultured Ferrimonas sp.]|uniref:multiheme c-type cytochrome n=1 Tax=uncultured Ferrimonas sp. TaxID=432640 RepID=UPI002620024C|nr:hypothetical protein [uncultured Ferrimonas sp.]